MKKRFVCALLTLILLVSLVPAGAISADAGSYTVSAAAITVLKQLETFKSKCDANGYIGYHTKCEKKGAHSGAHTISQSEADTVLREKLTALDKAVDSFASTNKLNLTQSKHDALVLFSFSNGTSWMNGAGDFRAAVISGKKGSDFINAILDWADNDDNTRRKVEANIYLNGVYSITAPTNFITVTFDAGSGTINGATKRNYSYDTSTNPAPHLVPTWKGCTFVGWYCNDKLVTTVTAKLDGQTLTARWISDKNMPWSDEETTNQQVAVSQLLSKYAYTCTWKADGSNITFAVEEDAKGKDVLASTYAKDGYLTITKVYVDAKGNRWGIINKESRWVRLPGQAASNTGSSSASTIDLTVSVVSNLGYVNRREKASIYSNKNGSYTAGTQLRIIDTATKDGFLWGKVAKDAIGTDSVGWIALMYTNYETVRGQASANYATGEVIATGFITYNGYVNVRSNAGTTNAIVGSLYKGAEVNIYETKYVNGLEWGRTDTGWFCMNYANVTRLSKGTDNSKDINYVSYVFTGIMTAEIPVCDVPAGTELTDNKLKKDASVTITGFAVDTYGVTWGKTSKGWVKVSEKDGTPACVKLDVAGFTVTSEVTVRDNPGNGGQRLNTLSKDVNFNVNNGTYQVVVANENLWGYANVLDAGTSGWINLSSKYVRRDGAAAAVGNIGKVGTVVGAETVRVRGGASLSGKVLGSIKQGTTVNILGEENGWFKIDYNVGSTEYDSWIYGQYVEVKDGTVASGSTSNGTGVGVIANTYGGVNVRATPGVGGTFKGKILPGTQVNILETKTVGSAQWGRVEQGWICMEYVQIISDLPADVLAALGTTGTNGSSSTTTGAEVAVYTGTTKQKVNVRKETSLDADIVRELEAGENITLHEILEVVTTTDSVPSTEVNGSTTTTTTKTTSYWARVNDGYIYNPAGHINLDTLDEATYTVTGSETLNVRESAGTDKTLVFTLKKGDQVKVTNVTIIGGSVWGNVECDQGTGWASLIYMTKGAVGIATPKPETSTTTTPATKPVGSTGNTGTGGFVSNAGGYKYRGKVINTDSLNVRRTASTGAAVDATLKRGASLVIYETCIAEGMAWGRCDAGWVYLFYVDMEADSLADVRVVYTDNTIAYTDVNCSEVAGTYSRMAVIEVYEIVGNMFRTDLGWVSKDNLL